jgi:hypothetical protein
VGGGYQIFNLGDSVRLSLKDQQRANKSPWMIDRLVTEDISIHSHIARYLPAQQENSRNIDIIFSFFLSLDWGIHHA